MLSSITINALEINMSKKFEESVQPNVLSAVIHIETKKKSERETSEILGKYNSVFSDNKNLIEEASGLSILPDYKYIKNERKFLGYIGNLRYTISSKNSKQVRDFLGSLLSKKTEEGVSIFLTSLKWVTSKPSLEKINEKLILNSIKWSQVYGKNMSDETGKSCVVSKININPNRQVVSRGSSFGMMESGVKSFKAPIPESSKESIQLNVGYVFKCS